MKNSTFEKLVNEAMEGQLFDDKDTFEMDDLQFDVGDTMDGESQEIDADEIIGEVLSLRDSLNGLLAKLGYEEEGEEEEGSGEGDELFSDEEEIEDLEKESVDMEAVPDSKGKSLQTGDKVVDNTGDLEGAGKDEGEKKQYRFVKIKKPEVRQTKTTD